MENKKFDTTNYINYETYRNENIKNIFIQLKEIILNAFDKLNYSTDDINVYYKRTSDKKSILAIKLFEGNNEDTENYMFNTSIPSDDNNTVKCKIQLYAESKSGLKAMVLNNLISTHLEFFFENIEKELIKTFKEDLEFGIIIPLDNRIIKGNPYTKQKK